MKHYVTFIFLMNTWDLFIFCLPFFIQNKSWERSNSVMKCRLCAEAGGHKEGRAGLSGGEEETWIERAFVLLTFDLTEQEKYTYFCIFLWLPPRLLSQPLLHKVPSFPMTRVLLKLKANLVFDLQYLKKIQNTCNYKGQYGQCSLWSQKMRARMEICVV